MNKNPKVDFHIKADKTKLDKAKKLSGFTNREIFELGCQFVIENNQKQIRCRNYGTTRRNKYS